MKASSFSAAIPVILEHEGGYVNDPVDSGGATNWGISLRFLVGLGELDRYDYDGDGDVDADDIRLMPREDAVKLYLNHFWSPGRYEQIAPQVVATKVFDMAVNTGPRQAHKILQSALAPCGEPVVVDGYLGAKTFGAVDRLKHRDLIFVLRAEQRAFYKELIARKPKLSKYENGWFNRALS